MSERGKVNSKFVIIGAGPIGLYAAIRFGLINQRVTVIDAKNEVGGQCSSLYKEKPIYDLPGILETTGQYFTNNLLEQFNKFEHILMLSTKVIDISKSENESFQITLDNGSTIFAEHLIISSGGGFYSPIDIGVAVKTGISEHIHYSLDDSSIFQNKTLAIFGGGDSAIDWTLMLSNIAEHITIVHRGKSFRASESNVQLLNNKKNISIILQSGITSIDFSEENKNKIEITLKNSDNYIIKNIDEILVFFGLKMESSISNFSITPELKNGRIIVSPTTLESSIKGLYAIGDISYYDYKKHNLTTGFGQCVQLIEYISKNYL